jgi:hypothetical protein
MSQDRKRGLFASLFGSKKKKEEELEAQRETRQKIDERISEVLLTKDTPELPTLPPAREPAIQLVHGGSESVHSRSSLQSGQFSMHLPQQESDSNLRVVPTMETLRPEPEQPTEFEFERWPVRRRAANG